MYIVTDSFRHTIDFTPHPGVKHYEKADKVVYYQTNPLANWGPAARAKNVKSAPTPKVPASASAPEAKIETGVVSEGTGAEKRKSEDGESKDGDIKKAKVDEANEEEGLNA